MRVLLLAALLLGGVAAWLLWRRSSGARRRALRTAPFPEHWAQLLSRKVPLYRALPPPLRDQLHGHVNVFLAEKTFQGCDGLAISDEIRLTVAAQACLLLLNRDTDYFPGFTTILVYPETYVAPEVRKQGPVESFDEDVRAGESWHRGPVVLSWGDVLRGTLPDHAGHNVVLHEFAHKLDEENDVSDGLPVLSDDAQYATWAEVFSREYESLQANAEQGEPAVLDHYGATSPAEFFAVATETFFEKPGELQARHRLLYEELRKFYKLDPCGW